MRSSAVMSRRDWEWYYPYIPFEYMDLYSGLWEAGLEEKEIIRILETEHGMPVWEEVLKKREIDKQRRHLIESMWEL